VLAGNLGQLSLARSRGFAVCGDFGLNLYNSRAMQYFYKEGLQSVTASFEMTLPQIRDLRKQLPTELIAYGRLPLMLTENCLIKNRTGTCACQSGSVKLVDRMGEEFRVVRDPGTCRSVILNGKKLYLLDKQQELGKLGLFALRLMFTTENPGEVNSVLSSYQNQTAFDPGACTRGLYLRGVE
jgi:putative protease